MVLLGPSSPEVGVTYVDASLRMCHMGVPVALGLLGDYCQIPSVSHLSGMGGAWVAVPRDSGEGSGEGGLPS